MQYDRDVIDLSEITGALRAGYRWILGGALVGVVAGFLIAMVLPRSYESSTTVLLRTGMDAQSGLLSGMGGGGIPTLGLASVLAGGSGYETEVEVLTSRSTAGAVVDSLGLQVVLLRPRGLLPLEVFQSVRVPADAEGARVTLRRRDGAYELRAPEGRATVQPGQEFTAGGARLVLAPTVAIEEIRFEILDRGTAVGELLKRTNVKRAGGDIARLTHRAPDPRAAAAVSNAMLTQYLARRRTTDRGLNQYRYEFLLEHTDSIGRELRNAEGLLRSYQESSGIVDPDVQGQAELEYALRLRSELEAVEIEHRALTSIASQAGTRVSARDLAAYPTFLRNPGVNDLLTSLLEAENQRTDLLERRTERDPDILALDRRIAEMERQVIGLVGAYVAGLAQQRAELRRELSRYEGLLATLPAHVESTYRLRRDVRRLSETMVALQTELVQARLAAITEGGEVRQIDPAEVPRGPAFPKLWLALALGLFVGLFGGTASALGTSYFSGVVRTPREAEAAAGVPALWHDGTAPLLIRAAESGQGTLVIPIGRDADARPAAASVARGLATRYDGVAMADWRQDPRRNGGAGAVESVQLVPLPDGQVLGARLLEELEARHPRLVVALPALDHPLTISVLGENRTVLLAGSSGALTRVELRDTVESLERLGMSIGGVLLDRGTGHSRA